MNDEDFFVKEREWAALYNIHVGDTRDKYQQVVSAKLRTSNQVAHLACLLKASVGGREGVCLNFNTFVYFDFKESQECLFLKGTNGVYNKLNSVFGSGLEGDKQALDGSVKASEESLGNYLGHWCPYVQEENNMLNRRYNVCHHIFTCLTPYIL